MIAASEPATILGRLAYKLGAGSIALVGCVRAPMLVALPSIRLAGYDVPEEVSYAAALRPDGCWSGLAAAATDVGRLPAPIAGISFRACETLSDEELHAVLGGVSAALVFAADDDHRDSLTRRREELAARGATILHEELIAPLGSATHRRTAPAFLVASPAGHDGARELTRTGFHSLRMDPEVDSWAALDRPARVLMISYEVVGPSRNGGIGTANTSLALALARHGHDVTVLFTGAATDGSGADHWRSEFARQGVTYEELDETRTGDVVSPFINVRLAWAAYQRARELHDKQPFDVIHAPECQGHLAFAALAKHQGLAFAGAELVTGVHSTTRWCAEANRFPLETISGLCDEQLERTAVRHADAVISPSGYLLGYLRTRGWVLPARTFVQQYTTSQAVREIWAGPSESDGDDRSAVDEIVFFGRLEARKGLVAFCDALDRLAGDPDMAHVSVTFMGSSTRTLQARPASDYVTERARAWPWPVRLLTDRSQPAAVRHLRSHRCVAVMPSLVDNSPNTVYEALALEIPIVVSRSGGTAELIAVDDLDRCSFAGWPDNGPLDPVPAHERPPHFDDAALAERLRATVRHPPTPAAPRVDAGANELAHVGWTAGLAARPAAGTDAGRDVPHVERLEPADDSVEAWNDAAQGARGDVLVVLPNRVAADPHLEEIVARVAAHSRADVFAFAARDASGRDIVPSGGPPVLGLSHPPYGTCGFAVRADALRGLGGFVERGADGTPVGDLVARASVSGLDIEVLPEVLVRCADGHWSDPARLWPEAVSWPTRGEEQLAAERPFQADGPLADLPAMYRFGQELAAELKAQADRLQEAHDRAREEVAAAYRQLDTLYNSRSWRLTEALRRVGRLARRAAP